MDERNGGVAASRTWCFVDWRCARCDHRGQRLGTVVHPIANVVQTFAALFDGFGHRRVLVGWREQLDVALGHLQQCLFDAIGLNGLAMLNRCAECALVVVDCGIKVAYGNGNVVNLSQQHPTSLRPTHRPPPTVVTRQRTATVR